MLQVSQFVEENFSFFLFHRNKASSQRHIQEWNMEKRRDSMIELKGHRSAYQMSYQLFLLAIWAEGNQYLLSNAFKGWEEDSRQNFKGGSNLA